MNTREGVHIGHSITYTGPKEATLMDRKPLSRGSLLRVVSIVLAAVLLAAPGSVLAQNRGTETWQAYMRFVSSFDDLQVLEDYIASIAGPEGEAERAAFLADPLAALDAAGVPFDAARWQITVIDMVRGQEAGTVGVSPRRDAERPAYPQCIGVSLDGVAMTVQLAGEPDPELGSIDAFFELLLNIDDALVGEILPIMTLLEEKSPDDLDRALWLGDAQPTLRDEFGVDFDRPLYRLTAIDYDLSDAYVAENGGDPIYTVAGGTDGPVGPHVIGFTYGTIAAIVALVQ